MDMEKPDAPAPAQIPEPPLGAEHELVRTGRRTFFATAAGILAGCVTVLYAIPYVRYLLYPVSVVGAGGTWSSLGPSSQFASITAPVSRLVTVKQNDGWLESQSNKAVYIIKDAQGRVEVLTAVCPHLGCTVQWSADRHQFLCPCHGSVFASDGARISGPTPRGMDSLPIRVESGQLMVRYEDFRQLVPTKEVLG